MLEAPRIVATEAQATAAIHLVIPRAEMQKVFGPGIGELMAAIAAQGLAVTGPVISRHLRNPTDTFDFEICVPVSSAVTPVGRVQPGRLPATTVARTVYRGPYEGLGAAWGEFTRWIKEQGYTEGAELWECYVEGPHSSPDPSTWRTEFNRPVTR